MVLVGVVGNLIITVSPYTFTILMSLEWMSELEAGVEGILLLTLISIVRLMVSPGLISTGFQESILIGLLVNIAPLASTISAYSRTSSMFSSITKPFLICLLKFLTDRVYSIVSPALAFVSLALVIF